MEAFASSSRLPGEMARPTFAFEPIELLEKLAALVPRPRTNLLLYHGVLAPNAKWRSRVVAYGADEGSSDLVEEAPVSAASASKPGSNASWAALMRRGFGLDVLACPCGGRMRFVAVILKTTAVRRILRHLGLPSNPVEPAPARSPPEPPEIEHWT